MGYLLGIDLGTSYFKLGIFDRRLNMLGLGRVRVPTISTGTKEEVPVESFWECLRDGFTQALESAGVTAGSIGALSWSSQANSFLLQDGAAQPLTPLILWTDTRTDELPTAVERLSGDAEFRSVSGSNSLGQNSAVSKVIWMRERDRSLWNRTARILSISDYLAYSLTESYRGDASTSSMLGLLDLRQLQWWPKALDITGISLTHLVTPLRTGAPLGRVSEQGSKILGLPRGAVVAAGALDHHAAALGAGVGDKAAVSESTGTVVACVTFSDAYNPRAGVKVLPGHRPGTYAELVFSGNGAGILEWYRGAYAPEISFAELDRLADAVAPDCDGLRALPMAHHKQGLEGFLNRKPGHGHGHYARAIMSSVTDTLGELLENLYPDGVPGRVAATGGGAHSDFWMRLKRDRLGIEIFPADSREPACKGAALLAGMAVSTAV